MVHTEKKTKKINPEELTKQERAKKIKEGELFEQPPSDSDDDICGPLNCDKEL